MKITIIIVIAFLIIVYVFTFLKWRKRKKKGINSVVDYNKRYIEKVSLKTRKRTALDKPKTTRPNASAIDYIEKERFFKE